MMSYDLSRLAFVVAIAVAPSLARASLQTGVGEASVSATGPAGLTIDGKTTDVHVAEEAGTVRVAVGLNGLDTGISLRNRHMREKCLETAKYPRAELAVPRASLQFPEEGRTVSASANGTMTLHGQSRAVTFTYRATRTHGQYDVWGAARLNMQEYGVRAPSYLGVSVKPEVDVRVHFVAGDP